MVQQPHSHVKVNSENSKAYSMSPVAHGIMFSLSSEWAFISKTPPYSAIQQELPPFEVCFQSPGTKTSLGQGALRAVLFPSHLISRQGLYPASMTSVFPGWVTGHFSGEEVEMPRGWTPAQRLQGVLIFPSIPVRCRVAGGGAPPLHPSQLPAERRWQRGVDKVFGGLPGPGERSQTLSHAAARPTGDADAEDPAQALCR